MRRNSIIWDAQSTRGASLYVPTSPMTLHLPFVRGSLLLLLGLWLCSRRSLGSTAITEKYGTAASVRQGMQTQGDSPRLSSRRTSIRRGRLRGNIWNCRLDLSGAALFHKARSISMRMSVQKGGHVKKQSYLRADPTTLLTCLKTQQNTEKGESRGKIG